MNYAINIGDTFINEGKRMIAHYFLFTPKPMAICRMVLTEKINKKLSSKYCIKEHIRKLNQC